jgi:Na+/H+-dicarboxylate symporter
VLPLRAGVGGRHTSTDVFEELQQLTVEPLHRLTGHLQQLVAGRLWLKVIIGMVAGVGVGFVLGPEVNLVAPERAHAMVSWLSLPGLVFLGLIQMIVIALVFASIIRGLGASDNVAQLKALGLRAAVYFVFTSALAIGLGLGVALLIQPGSFIDGSALAGAAPDVPTLAQDDVPIPERVAGLLPDNPIAAMAEGQLLEIVIFAIVVGIALVSMPVANSKPLFDLLGAVQAVCMTVVKWGMRLAPLAVFGLMTRVTATMGLETLAGMGVYVGTVLAGLAALLGAYLLLVGLVARMSPWKFLGAAREVQLLAFSTSSSAAVMPLKTAEEKLGVRPRSARFLIPLGATVNMDGTALYQGVATIFLAQAFDIDLSVGQMLLVVVTAVAASIGAPATPGVGIVVLATVLSGVGIPTAGIAIILGVDRILDMSRTAVNVTGDLTAALVLDRWLGEDLPPAAPGEAAPADAVAPEPKDDATS